MDRREFLRQGAWTGLLGAGAAAQGACATTGLFGTPSSSSSTPPVDMHAFLAQLDTSLALMQRADFFRDLAAVAHPGGVDQLPGLALRETLTRKALRTLTLTGSFLDLEEQDRAHPGMQARMWGALAEMDEAVEGMGSLLGGLPTDARREVQSKLRGQPGLLRDVAASLDTKATMAGLSAKRRRHLQRLLGQVGWRLREQDPGLVIDEYMDALGKTTRQHAQRGAQATGEVVLPPQAIASGPGYVSVVPPPQQHGRSGRGVMTVGGIMMGLSAAGGLAGIALVAAEGSSFGALGVFGLVNITVGALGLLAGLVVLIVGAAIAAAQSGPAQSAPPQNAPASAPEYLGPG